MYHDRIFFAGKDIDTLHTLNTFIGINICSEVLIILYDRILGTLKIIDTLITAGAARVLDPDISIIDEKLFCFIRAVQKDE